MEQYNDDVGFDVTEEIDLGDLSDVKEERPIVPPSRSVLLEVRKASNNVSKSGAYRQINLSLALVDGIQVGEETKYKGKVVFARVCYWADPETYTKDWFKNKQHLVALQQLLEAIDMDIKNVKFNDDLLRSLEGKKLLADIVQKKNQFTAKDGTEVDETVNDVIRFKHIPVDAQV
tara:strand:+ start:10891 stop:11415 length:525 start_codon:yes stop_codon:yes gene_type:complete